MNEHLPPGLAPGIAAPTDAQEGSDGSGPLPVPVPPPVAAIARDGPQAERFACLLQRRFVPAAPIRAALATGAARPLLDAFVQPIGDSLAGPDPRGRIGIFDALAQAAATLAHGGAVGIDFSPLRPRGSRVAGSAGGRAAGPAAYLRLFEQLHDTVRGPDAVRGSVTATLRIDHPDLLAFLAAATTSGGRRCVALTDAFMRALRDDGDFEVGPGPATGSAATAAGSRGTGRANAREPRPVGARELWQAMLRRSRDKMLGLPFIDSGPAPESSGDGGPSPTPVFLGGPLLPPYGALAHGNLLLPAFLTADSAGETRFDWAAFGVAVADAVELLDRVLDLTRCPLPQQQVELQNRRPIGLGCRGLSDTLAALGLRPGGEDGIAFAQRLWTALRGAAVLASVQLARSNGTFPLFNADRYLGAGSFGSTLPPALQSAIRQHGLRNSRLLSAWLADARGRKGMSVDERLRMLATVAPLVDGGTAMPIRIPRDCAMEGAAGIVIRAWQAGARSILLHR